MPAIEVCGVVGEGLQLINGHSGVIVQHVVVRRLGGSLEACMAVEVPVVLSGVRHRVVHHRACARRHGYSVQR